MLTLRKTFLKITPSLYCLRGSYFSNLLELEEKIDSVQRIKGTCTSMRSIAASKIYDTERTCLDFRPFSESLEPFWNSNTEKESKVKKNLIILVTTNFGLCGGINTSISRMSHKYIDEITKKKQDYKFLFIGSKGKTYYTSDMKNGKFISVIRALHENKSYSFENTIDLVDKIILNEKGYKFDKAVIFYNYYVNKMKHQTRMRTLYSREIYMSDTTHLIHYENDLANAEEKYHLNNMFEYCFANILHKSIVENMAVEQSSRWVKMDNAIKNMEEMLKELQLEYNSTRQSNITTEICEVNAGKQAIDRINEEDD